MKNLSILFVFFGLIISSFAIAQTTNWTGASSNNWSDAGNWDNGVPTATSDAMLNVVASATIVIQGGTNAVAKHIFIANSSSLTVEATATLTVSGASSHGIHLFGNGSSFTNHGTTNISNSGSTSLFFQAGPIGVNSATGTINIDGGNDAMNISNTSFDNDGSVNIGPNIGHDGVQFGNAATLNNNCGGQFNILGVGVDRDGLTGSANGTAINNAGVLCINDSNVSGDLISTNITFNNTGTYNTSGCATTTGATVCPSTIPIMGEWALITLGLIVLSFGIVYVMKWNKQTKLTLQS